MNVTCVHFQNICKCNILGDNICSLLLLYSSKMGNIFWCCFCHLYANTNVCEKLVFKNFSVIFPGCGLKHNKGSSKFPFSEEHTIRISYRLFKMHHKIDKHSFFSYVCVSSLHYRCCLYNFSKARLKCYIAMLLISPVPVKNSNFSIKE